MKLGIEKKSINGWLRATKGPAEFGDLNALRQPRTPLRHLPTSPSAGPWGPAIGAGKGDDCVSPLLRVSRTDKTWAQKPPAAGTLREAG